MKVNPLPISNIVPRGKWVSSWLKALPDHLPAVGASACDLTSLFPIFLSFIMEITQSLSVQRKNTNSKNQYLEPFFPDQFGSTTYNTEQQGVNS